jgi:hypothetical protein
MAWVASGIGLTSPFEADRPGDLTAAYAVLGAWLLCYLLVAPFVVADAVRLNRRDDLATLQESANLVKLIAIPFFLLNFVVLAAAVTVAGAGDQDRFGLDGFLVALLFIILTYLAFLPTSAYGVACLLQLKKRDQIGRAFFGGHVVLHFLYVVDVISTIVVVEVVRNRLGITRRPSAVQRNLMPVVLALGSAVATLWLACVAIYNFGPYDRFASDGMFQLTVSSPAAFILLVVVPVVPLITLRAAVRLYLIGDLDALSRSARTVKLTMIPLFVQNFLLSIFIVLAVAFFPVIITRGALIESGPVMAFLSLVAAIGFIPTIFCTYLMLLPTSIYSLTTVALLTRRRALTPGACALHTVLQLLFLTDIISTLVVTQQARQLSALPPQAWPGQYQQQIPAGRDRSISARRNRG